MNNANPGSGKTGILAVLHFHQVEHTLLPVETEKRTLLKPRRGRTVETLGADLLEP